MNAKNLFFVLAILVIATLGLSACGESAEKIASAVVAALPTQVPPAPSQDLTPLIEAVNGQTAGIATLTEAVTATMVIDEQSIISGISAQLGISQPLTISLPITTTVVAPVECEANWYRIHRMTGEELAWNAGDYAIGSRQDPADTDSPIVSWFVCQEDGSWLEVYENPALVIRVTGQELPSLTIVGTQVLTKTETLTATMQVEGDCLANHCDFVYGATIDSSLLPVEGAFLPFDFEGEVYTSPFTATTDVLEDSATHPYWAEPGVFPGMKMASGEWSQTAWDEMQTSSVTLLVPEGGGRYVSWGGGCAALVHPELTDQLGEEVLVPLGCWPKLDSETGHLTFFRGRPSDGGDEDRNLRVYLYNYVDGAALSHILPLGAYWSLGWTIQQIENAWEPASDSLEWPCAGDNGCDHLFVEAVDLESLVQRVWLIGDTVRDWQRVESWEVLTRPTR